MKNVRVKNVSGQEFWLDENYFPVDGEKELQVSDSYFSVLQELEHVSVSLVETAGTGVDVEVNS